MKEILDEIAAWRTAGHRMAVARVVGVDGSGPREPGAALVVNDAGEIAGSVSGGCVEGAVVEEALQVIAGGPARLVTYGIADEDAFAVGLTCGGTIHLLIEPLDWWPVLDTLAEALAADEPVALATVVAGPALGTRLAVRADGAATGGFDDPLLDGAVRRDALGQLEAGATGTRHYGLQGEARKNELSVFVESFAPPPRMIIFGAVDFTAALARLGQGLGYRVTVCDARPAFTTRARFPSADEVVVEWPDSFLERVGPTLTPLDAICVLTHDHKFDVPAILEAVKTRAGYIGAMGSRRTTHDRAQRLLAAGIDEESLARVTAPIGIDIGARTPAETAVSICAEIIAGRARRSVPALQDGTGPIHAAPARAVVRVA